MATDTATDGHSTPADEPIHVDSADELDDVVDGQNVVLADFYADWCGPCQMLEPVVETIAAETDATVAKVDADANQQLAATYGVRGVPTLILFAGGETVDEMVGVRSADELRSTISEYTGA